MSVESPERYHIGWRALAKMYPEANAINDDDAVSWVKCPSCKAPKEIVCRTKGTRALHAARKLRAWDTYFS